MSVTPSLKIEPNRVIEHPKYGRFYIMGNPEFGVLYVPDPHSEDRTGYIVIDGTYTSAAGVDPLSANKLFRMTEAKLIPAMFKSRAMAEEVCHLCNKRL